MVHFRLCAPLRQLAGHRAPSIGCWAAICTRTFGTACWIGTKPRELLASFFIKGCEWIQSETPVGTGDAQHYQNLVLAGVDENGKEVANEATFLVLDIVEELAISDFPITVRLNKHTPLSLKEKIARVMRPRRRHRGRL